MQVQTICIWQCIHTIIFKENKPNRYIYTRVLTYLSLTPMMTKLENTFEFIQRSIILTLRERIMRNVKQFLDYERSDEFINFTIIMCFLHNISRYLLGQ